MSDLIMAVNQQVGLVASFHDSLGRLVPLADPHWTSDAPSVIALIPADGLRVSAYSLMPGSATITAELGSLTDTKSISVVNATMSTISVKIGTPIDTIIPAELLD